MPPLVYLTACAIGRGSGWGNHMSSESIGMSAATYLVSEGNF